MSVASAVHDQGPRSVPRYLTRQAVVAKGVVSPRPAYAPIAAEIILVDTPGVTSADLSRFPYRQSRRPLYPFERDARYPAAK